MQKTVLLILLLTTLLFSETNCKVYSQEVVKTLKSKYAKDIKDDYKLGVPICSDIEKENKSILTLPYSVGDEDVYSLSLILAIVDNKSKKVEQSYFHKDIASSDAIYISSVKLDGSLYKKSVLQLIISFYGSSRANPFSLETLFLYQIKKKRLKPILENLTVSRMNGENDMCNYFDASHNYEWLNKKRFRLGSDIKFEHQYGYEESYCKDESKEEHWEVKLEPKRLTFKDGRYVVAGKEKPVFDLKEIDKSCKKGLKYKMVVLKAMLFENPLLKSNLREYNNIAYYLQQSKHNREAIFLLEKIIDYFPKRVVAYLNLADAYWGSSNHNKAIKSYREYVKLMKRKGLKNKIPAYVIKRLK